MTSTGRSDWLRLILATILIAAVVVPWTSYEDHGAHWINARWMPFAVRAGSPPSVLDRARGGAEMAGNIVLYVPFGLASRRLFGPWRTLALAVSLSTLTEWSQLYSHERIPSTADVICNLAGAWIGIRWRERYGLRGTDPQNS